MKMSRDQPCERLIPIYFFVFTLPFVSLPAGAATAQTVMEGRCRARTSRFPAGQNNLTFSVFIEKNLIILERVSFENVRMFNQLRRKIYAIH